LEQIIKVLLQIVLDVLLAERRLLLQMIHSLLELIHFVAVHAGPDD